MEESVKLNNSDIIKQFSNSNFVMVNKDIVKLFGSDVGILFGFLCDYQRYFGGNEFFKEQEQIILDTGLTLYSIRQALKILSDNKILKITKKGLPAKNYYYINGFELLNLIKTKIDCRGSEFGMTSQTISDFDNSMTSGSEFGMTSGSEIKKHNNNTSDINSSDYNHSSFLSDIKTNNTDNIASNVTSAQKETNGNKSSVLGKINISFSKTQETKRAEPKTKQDRMILNLQKEIDYLDKPNEVKDLLKQWIAVIVKNKGGIQIEQIKLALENLDKITKKDEDLEKEIIKKATMLGYLDFNWVKIEKKQKNPFIHNPNKVDDIEEIYRKQQNNEYIDWSTREFYDDGTPVKKY